MRISSSNVLLNSAQINIKSSSAYESLHTWDKNTDCVSTISRENIESAVKKTVIKDKVDLKNPPPSIFHEIPTHMFGNTSDDTMKKLMDGSISDVRLQLIKDIIEMLTGKEIKVLDPSDTDGGAGQSPVPAASDAPDQASNPKQRTPQGWGLDYYFKETNYSKEGASFSASGSIKTADGKTVKFSVSMEMSRETLDERSVSLKAGDALIDPLIIDLSGTGVSFSNVKFEFDLAANGTMQTMSAPSVGSGFLAYDKNGNGLIDDGSELFGPTTGSGFNELEGLDGDHNGWIDENDPAFSSLKIWQKNADDTDQISTLREKDVGALYCGSAKTQFDIAQSGGSAATMAARLKESGIWLKESGGAGVLQEVDLVV
jgi:hypothetical protein